MKRFLILFLTLYLNDMYAQERIILLNEGMWQADNGRVTYFEDGQVVSNQWFRDVNGYKLGDTPNDIIQVNENLIAIAINWSNIVQFITPEGRAVAATEDIPNNRKLCSDGKFVYVTSYGHECETINGTVYFDKGFVAKIDISSFKVVATCEVGYEPEGIALYKGHLFIANTGGYAEQEGHEYETTVSIVNAATMQLERNVNTYVPNLYGKISQSGRYLCINSPGDYYEVPPCGLIFDCEKALSSNDCFVKFNYPATYNTTTLDGKFLAVGSNFSYITGEYEFSYLTIEPWIFIRTRGQSGLGQTLPGSMGTDFADMGQPYGIYVNPYTGYIYGTDAGSFESAGDLYQWSPAGQLLSKHKVYINPGHFLALAPDGHKEGVKNIEGIYYILNKEKKIAEVTYSPNSDIYEGDIVIPSFITYNGETYGVIKIGNSAFRGCSGLTSVTIPESVTDIGDFAFYNCSSLTTITIPNSVKSIGDEAFQYCSGLTSLAIGSGLTSIGNRAFYECSNISSLKLDCKIIDDWFSSCRSLRTLMIGDNVRTIGDSAFCNCTSLSSVTIGSNVTSIHYEAFKGCYFARETFVNNSALQGNWPWGATFCDEETEDGLLINNYCVVKCRPWAISVNIPEGVKEIGNNAFEGCYDLSTIIFPESLTSIANYAFSGTPWYDNQPDGLVYAGKIVYKYKGNMPAGTHISIKEGTIGIASYAFRDCSGLTSITIPNSLTSIGNSAFQECIGLTSVHITDIAAWCKISFENIESQPLYYAHHLFVNGQEITDLTIPQNVTSISNSTFEGCNSLTSVTIPESVTSIGYYAFWDCSNLTAVTIPESVTYIAPYAFAGTPWYENLVENQLDGLIYLGRIAYAYKGEIPEGTEIVIKEGTVMINDGLFYERSGMSSVTIPNSVTSIGEGAFYGCTGLTSITIPESVTTIGYIAFCGCTGMNSITIPSSVNSFGYEAFRGCSNLASLNICCENVGPFAFEGCGSLQTLTFGEHVKSIDDGAFRNCIGLKDICCYAVETLKVSEYAFYGVKVDSVLLGVPENAIEQYKAHPIWGQFLIDNVTGVNLIPDLYNDSEKEKGKNNYYDLNGRQQNTPQKGMNVIRYSDGTSKKLLVK